MSEQLTLRDRRQVLDHLDTIAAELTKIANWLTLLDQDHEAVRVECAARDLEAACWQLSTPVRLRLSVGPNGQPSPLGG
jgi:hypothetical protein